MSLTLLQMQNASKSFGTKDLFLNCTFSINDDEHVGVIGPNGAGKSTLFKALINELSLDQGAVVHSKELKLAYLTQHDDWDLEHTVANYLENASPLPLWELKSMARPLGLSDQHFASPLKSLSGGYRMRVKLLKLASFRPNLMLLDEPTNYLDLETLVILENFLVDFKGAFMVISHDREFLKRVTDHTLEIEQGAITKFPGHVEDYFEQKEMWQELEAKKQVNLANKRAELEKFIERFKSKASKARQAQSKMKVLDKMETLSTKPLALRAKIFVPAPVDRSGKKAIVLKDAAIGYGEKTILPKVNLELAWGNKVGIVGYNGAGKSTLLKTLAGFLPVLQGERELGHYITVGLYHQHVTEALNEKKTVLEELESASDLTTTRQEILNLAGQLLFSGDDVSKKIALLSGGERARVALGKMLLGKYSCILLDEPTNHLDFYTVEALANALRDYSGTVVVVSHDRLFIKQIADKIVEIRDGEVSLYPGDYDHYVWKINQEVNASLNEEESSSTTKIASDNSSGKERYQKKKELESKERSLAKEIQKLDISIEKLRLEIAELEIKLNHPNPEDLPKLITQFELAQKTLAESEDRWLTASDERENLLQALNEMKGQ